MPYALVTFYMLRKPGTVFHYEEINYHLHLFIIAGLLRQ